MIDYEDDLNELLSTDDFGIVFTYSGTEYPGILADEYFDDETGEAGFAGSKPVLYTTVVIPKNTTLDLGGVNYRVAAPPQPNKRGLVMLVLHEL